MRKEFLLDKISSKYIISQVFMYIKDKNFSLKLFIHSKYFQSKLNIKLIDYKEQYLEKRINYDNLIFINDDFIYYNGKKDLYQKELQRISLEYKIDENTFIKFVSNYYINLYQNYYKKDNIYKYLKRIDLDSPLFESLSKIENFEKIFTIVISTEDIKNYEKQYLSNLNKLNTCYSLEIKDMIYLKNLDINFNNIKYLRIFFLKYFAYINFEYNKYFNILFSLGNLKSNLIYLNLEGRVDTNPFSSGLLENINTLKSLEYLFLSYFEDTSLLLKLDNLKELYLERFSSIYFEKNIFLKLKNLTIKNCTICISPELDDLIIKTKCPLLEKCMLIDSFEDWKLSYDNFIDFSSITKLKKYEGNPEYFLLINNNNPLEKVYLSEGIVLYKNDDGEKNILIKLCTIKTIKKMTLILRNIDFKDISNIADINPSVKKIKIFYSDKFDIQEELQKKFPNLTDFGFQNSYDSEENNDTQIEILENSESKIINMKLYLMNNLINKFYCKSFSKLECIILDICCKIGDYQKFFPIFNNKCTVIFESLKVFHCYLYDYNLNILNNLCNNINKMPNLKDFCLIFDCDTNVDKKFYINLIKEIISLKYIRIFNVNPERNLINIEIGKKNKEENNLYTKDELSKLLPENNLDKLYEINIIRYQINDK